MPLTIVSEQEIPTKRDRGGVMQVLLSPRTVNTTSGFMGTLTLEPNETYGKHYHPYSDEYLYIISGQVSITDDHLTRAVEAGSAAFIPKNVPHSLHNTGAEKSCMIFFSTPLAPRPELGHVLLEE